MNTPPQTFDRALARKLWEAGVPEGPLQSALAEVEARRDLSLGVALVAQGLVSARAVEEAMASLAAASGVGVAPSPTPLGDYEVLGVLGQGGMGVVQRVRHRLTGAEYALKRCFAAADPVEHERLIREGEILARLDHPGLVRVHSADFSGEAPAFVLELLEGGSLQDRLRHGPLPVDEALRIVRAIAEAVAYLHQEGVLHRDLKPLNVLFDAQGRPRLTDFGLARARGALTMTNTGELLGTPGYMAPEQVLDPRQVDARSDVYALGAILFATLTGAPPFKGATALGTLDHVLSQAPPTLRESRGDDEAQGLEALVAQALAKEASERPESAEAFAAGLDAEAGAARTGSLALGAALSAGLLCLAAGLAYALWPAEPSSTLSAASPGAPEEEPAQEVAGEGGQPRDLGPGLGLAGLSLNEAKPQRRAALKRAFRHEESLLVRLYPSLEVVRRDAALIAAVDSQGREWFGGDSDEGTIREQRGRRWRSILRHGDGRSAREFAKLGLPPRLQAHVLWVGFGAGDIECGETLLKIAELSEDQATLLAFLSFLSRHRSEVTRPKLAGDLPSFSRACRTLEPILPKLRGAAPLPRRPPDFDPQPLSPGTTGRRVEALITRFAFSSASTGLHFARAQRMARLAREELGEDAGADLFRRGGGDSRGTEAFLASALVGYPRGLARFAWREVRRALSGTVRRERALRGLVLAVVAFDSRLAARTEEVALEERRVRYANLEEVLSELRMFAPSRALAELRESLGEPASPRVLALLAKARELLEPVFEACLAVERGEPVSTLERWVPRLVAISPR